MKNQNTKHKLLFITGDIHYGELNRIRCINNNDQNYDYFDVEEITSSSMNAPFASQKGDTALLLKWFFDIYFKFENDLIAECRNLEKNFGEIEFIWKQSSDKQWFIDKIWLRLIGENNDIGCQREIQVGLSEMEGNWENAEDTLVLQTIPLYDINDTDYKCYSLGRINYSVFQLGIRNIMLRIFVSILIYFPFIIAIFIFCLILYGRTICIWSSNKPKSE